MMSHHLYIPALLAFGLVACGGSEPATADDAAPAAAVATAASDEAEYMPTEDAQRLLDANAAGSAGGDHERMVAGCLASTNNERPMCECVANRAGATLSPNAYALVLATFEGDAAAAAALRVRLDIQEATSAATFQVRAFAACARELADY